MNAKQRHLNLSVVWAAVACFGFYACNSGSAGKRDGGPGGGNGGAAGGSGGTATVDAPVGASGGVVGIPVGTGGYYNVDGGRMGSGGKTGSGGVVGNPVGTGGYYSVDGGRPGSGGKTGSGGAALDGGMPGSGGKGGGSAIDGGKDGVGRGTGGSYVDGGAPGSGGKTGAGGIAGIDAGPVPVCGGEGGLSCQAGQFCDITDHCGMMTDGGGRCVPTGPTVVCGDVYQPVCGCNGRSYANDCERGAAGVQKFSDGECAEARDASSATDRNAGVTWQAAGVGATSGPGIVVTGRGWYVASTRAGWQNLESMIFDGTPSYSLSSAQLDDLFARLAAVDLSSLPHAISGTASCNAKLVIGTCASCSVKTLTYSSAAQLAPEMEPVWAWFDQVLGSPTAATNPRTYCRQ